MKIDKLLIAGMIITSSFLAGCSNYKLVESGEMEVKVLKINPPKRYYVEFENIKNGEVFNEYIAKRCSAYEAIKIGDVYKLNFDLLINEEGKKKFVFKNKADVFCPK